MRKANLIGGYKESGMGNEGFKDGIDDDINIKYSCTGDLGLYAILVSLKDRGVLHFGVLFVGDIL